MTRRKIPGGVLHHPRISLAIATVLVLTIAPHLIAEDLMGSALSGSISVEGILEELRQEEVIPTQSNVVKPWWEQHVQGRMRGSSQATNASVQRLLKLALDHSAQLQVYSEVPLIRETAITEADSAFDWSRFADALWEDTSEPVGSSLTVGGNATRFNDHNLGVTAGVRRRNIYGGSVELSQRIGHQNNNSTFFIPQDQGTTRLSLSYTHPLLRGRGAVYNRSLTVLAQIDTKVARDEFERQLETHLLEVSRAYWALYLERGLLAQKVNLFARTRAIVQQLERRQHIDTQPTQMASARAALAERRSELVRAQAAVKNAETRIRGLLNAPELGFVEEMEVVPSEPPTSTYIPFDLFQSIETAVQNRSEVLQAMKQIRAGCVRMKMAKHEIMPQLNLVTQTYLAGLRGRSDIGGAWVDQFSEGAPSYSVGLQFEVPVGRRAANARLTRRRIELRQLQAQYQTALETVKNEVEVAVREVETAFGEMVTKQQSMEAASMEAVTIENRWSRLPNTDGSAALVLESLLRAQERVTQAESDFLTAQMTYNLALMNIKRAMGVLVETENVSVGRACSCNIPQTILDKTDAELGMMNEESMNLHDVPGIVTTINPE